MNTQRQHFTGLSMLVPLSGIISPRPVTVELRHLQATDRASIDALADRALAEERQRNLDALAEEQTEARSFPQRLSRHDD